MSRRQTQRPSVTVDRAGVGLNVRRVMGVRVWPPLRRRKSYTMVKGRVFHHFIARFVIEHVYEVCRAESTLYFRQRKFPKTLYKHKKGNYTSNALSKCSWLIENDQPGDKMIQLKLANFSTECGWDHLYIFDGTSALKSTTIGAYCGIVKQQHTMYATSGSVFLNFCVYQTT